MRPRRPPRRPRRRENPIVFYRTKTFAHNGAEIDACVGIGTGQDEQLCSVVQARFGFGSPANWGVTLGNRQGEAPIFHVTGVTRIHQPEDIWIYIKGKTEARLLAEALIFAGSSMLEDLDRGGTPESDLGGDMDFPWNMHQRAWVKSWELIPDNWEELIDE